jgi:hypothetical protein
VVEFLESGEFHGYDALKKGVNPLVSQRPYDVFRGTTTSPGGFIVFIIHKLYGIKLGNIIP